MSSTPDSEPVADEERVISATLPYLRERLYAAYTGIAIVRVIEPTGHDAARHAFLALLFGVIAIVIAGTVSEYIAHLLVHRTVARGRELRVMMNAAGGALGTALIPLGFIILGWTNVLDLDTALWLAATTYLLTLGLIGWTAVRRAHLSSWGKVVVMFGLMLLGVLVIFVQQIAKTV